MLKPIKTSKQHKEYLTRAYELMQKDIKPNTFESDELEVISILIEQYEKDKHPIAPPSPIEAILFRLDQMGMKKSELKSILGSRSRVSCRLPLKSVPRLPLKNGPVVMGIHMVKDHNMIATFKHDNNARKTTDHY
jgi:HTH-type transcriptional regulator/antitoxin HigA